MGSERPSPTIVSLSLGSSDLEDPESEREIRERDDYGSRQQALRILGEMRKLTPPGSVKPWRTERAIRTIERVLGYADPGELLELVRGAATIIRRSPDRARFWTVPALFDSRAADIWRNEVFQLFDSERQADANQTALEKTLHPEPTTTFPPSIHRELWCRMLDRAGKANPDGQLELPRVFHIVKEKP